MASEEDILKNIVDHVVSELGLEEYTYTCDKLGKTIQNYFGTLIPVTLTGLSDDRETKISVIIKMSPTHHKLKAVGVVAALYKTEIYVYCELLPLYKKLQTNVNINELIPECYYTDSKYDHEVLVLKDLRGDGFKTFTDRRFLDVAHVTKALESLAKFHALSIISQETGQSMDLNILQPFSLESQAVLIDYLKILLEYAKDLFTDLRIKRFLDDMVVNYKDCVERSTKKVSRLVIGHGDYWKDNILFKYENNIPVHSTMLDFQLTRQMSPAEDFLNFILASTDTVLRRQHFTNFLQVYWDNLQKTLQENHFDAQILYSMNDLQNDLKNVALTCFMKANMSFVMWLGLNDRFEKFKYKSESEKTCLENRFKDIIGNIIYDLEYFGCITMS